MRHDKLRIAVNRDLTPPPLVSAVFVGGVDKVAFGSSSLRSPWLITFEDKSAKAFSSKVLATHKVSHIHTLIAIYY